MKFSSFQELKTYIDNNYKEIRDLVYCKDKKLLDDLESGIKYFSKNDKQEDLKKLVIMYKAIFDVAYEEYHSSVGTKYQCENFKIIKKAILDSEIYFTNGYYNKYLKDTIVSVKLKNYKIDFIFGKIKNLLEEINNDFFIIFKRKDINDFELFKEIDKWLDNESSIDELIKKGIVYERT